MNYVNYTVKDKLNSISCNHLIFTEISSIHIHSKSWNWDHLVLFYNVNIHSLQEAPKFFFHFQNHSVQHVFAKIKSFRPAIFFTIKKIILKPLDFANLQIGCQKQIYLYSKTYHFVIIWQNNSIFLLCFKDGDLYLLSSPSKQFTGFLGI